VRWLILNGGLLLALAACSSSSSFYEPTGAAATTTSSTGTSGGGTSGGGSGGGATVGGGSTGEPEQLGVTLSGDLAFPVAFAGEFYGSLPDGGADLSNLDCRISDGTDLGQLCTPMLPLSSDGGTATSWQIIDIYVTSVSATRLTQGMADVSTPYSDGGVFATIELTLCPDGGSWDFERALYGQVVYQATASGMFGQFHAVFPGYPDGGGVLDGTFGAGYCGPLNSD